MMSEDDVSYFDIDHIILEGWTGSLPLPQVKHEGQEQRPLLQLEINLLERKCIMHFHHHQQYEKNNVLTRHGQGDGQIIINKETIDALLIGSHVEINQVALSNGEEIGVLLEDTESMTRIMTLRFFMYGDNKSVSASNLVNKLRRVLLQESDVIPRRPFLREEERVFKGPITPNKTFHLKDASMKETNRTRTNFSRNRLKIVVEYPSTDLMTPPSEVTIQYHDPIVNETKGMVVYSSSSGDVQVHNVRTTLDYVMFDVRQRTTHDVELTVEVHPTLDSCANIEDALRAFSFT